MKNLSAQDGKTLAIVSYFTIIGWLIALFLNKDKDNYFTKFHLRQALGIHLILIINKYIPRIYILFLDTKSIITIIGIALLVIGIVYASKEEEKPLPIVGEYFQDWFKSL
ncbi:conserved membrane protein of unknown function [Tenacibaculum sp. 190130A14a]|uniref:Import component protein n=1 Tax=Tenacibaculum polynesiense TaxID=3137857 RepID=A0ABM9PFY3_9FLAO